jgi:hypothetical protein
MMSFNKLFFAMLISLQMASTFSAQIANYIGTGQSPRIKFILSANGAKWSSFTIDYQQLGNIPFTPEPSNRWSSWDIKDSNNNYYGSITLISDGKTASFTKYTKGMGDYYLDGVTFSYNNKINAYQLTVDKIHGGDSNKGPFPTTPLAKPAEYPGTDNSIILSVRGTQIINNMHKPIWLKGVVRPSLEWNPQGQNLSENDIKNMASWGGNVIRIDLNQNYWLASEPASEKGSYKQIINAIIHHSMLEDMVVILDLHWTEDGHQTPMANKDSLRFWKEVANDYKSFGTVIFELFNEPYSIPPSVWLNGDNTYAGFQQLYDAVRSTGANNICIINGLDYGYDLSFVNENFGVKGTNIVYGSHPYDEKGRSGYSGPGGSLEGNLAGVINLYPIFFTEFGVNKPSYFPTKYKAIYQFQLKFINDNKINYTAFAWWVDTANPNIFPDIIKDWNGTPLNGGVYIKQDLLVNEPTKVDFD